MPEAIEVVRKRKQKTLVVHDYLIEPFEVTGNRATFSLEAKPTGSLRPDVLLEHCTFEGAVASITRIAQR